MGGKWLVAIVAVPTGLPLSKHGGFDRLSVVNGFPAHPGGFWINTWDDGLCVG